jgi:hypothetical protein
MGLLSDLLLWHAQDPVDDRERLRNDVVQSFQGNRNPFVDHPEWADCIYGGDCDGDPPPAVLVWINEIHYDNASNDAGEFVEIAGPAGTVLDGWSLVGYNGGDSMVYKTVPLSGTIPDQQACHGTLAFDFVDLQNGAPDAVALVNSADAVVQFLSYEGVLTAADGPAIGMVSTDISVAESGSTPVGFSLQLGGMGKDYPDFMWQMELDDTPGQPNMNQIFADDECVAGPTTQDIVDYVLRRTDDDTGLDLNDDDQVDAADVVLSIPVP